MESCITTMMTQNSVGFKIGFIVDVRSDVLRPYQITVPGLYSKIPDDLLPWARVGSLGGGSYDTGGMHPYVKGASVGLLFENGDRFKPVIICGVNKAVGETQEYELFPEETTYTPNEGRPVEMASDGPVEALESGVYTILKSPKGHTMVISEAPGGEYLKVIDRAGQELEMVCPVTEAANQVNAAQRGDGEAAQGTALDYIKMSGPAYVKLTDLSGNYYELYSEDGEERVVVENPAHGNKFTFDKTGLKIVILNGKDGGGLTIEGTANGLKVNGQYLATESLVDWLNAFKTNLIMSTKPGNPEPIFPEAQTDFVTKRSSSVNNDGLKTQLD